MDKMKQETPDLTARNVERIAALFPNCVTEMRDEKGKVTRGIDFALLKQMLSPAVVEGAEHYEFSWVGKKAALVEANKSIRKTLRPCPEESKDWDTTENLYIEGDNLEVLKLLQESYLGKVKMIYIDPPYNTGNDFIYADNFMRSQQEENEQIGISDEVGNRLFRNTDTNGRFHSDWCSMMYSRLMLARNLLADDGVIFISIDDNEQANLKHLCDEIFGVGNFIAIYKWNKTATPPALSDKVRGKYEYVLCYEKVRSGIKYCGGIVTGGDMPLLNETNMEHELTFPAESVRFTFSGIFPKGKYDRVSLLENVFIENGRVKRPVRLRGKFKWVQDTVDKEIKEGTSFIIKSKKFAIRYCRAGERIKRPSDVISKEECCVGTNEDGAKDVAALFGENVMSYPKPVSLIKYLIPFAETTKDSLILDFFSGSATTAHAVMQLNAEDGGKRKFIMVQLPEPCDKKSSVVGGGYKTICEIGKERIRRAGEKIRQEHPEAKGLDVGFRVLKLADSNMKDVFYAPEDYDQSILAKLESNIKEDRSALDLLFGCLLEWGLPLGLPYTVEQIEGCAVHVYNDGDLIACFEEKIPESVVTAIARRKPLRAVFRDSGFADSPAKINVFEIFKRFMPEDADDISKRVRVF